MAEGKDTNMKTSKRNKRTTRKRGSGLRAVTGYLAKGSILGELVLFENFIEQHCKEIRERVEYLERIAKRLARVFAASSVRHHGRKKITVDFSKLTNKQPNENSIHHIG